MSEKLKLPSRMFTRAAFEGGTLNDDARTVEVMWSTGAQVRRWFGMEELSMDPAHVRMAFLNDGAPVLNNHNRGTEDVTDEVIGRVVPGSARITNGVGTATLEFDTDEQSERVFQKIKRGFLRYVSVGYSVHKFERIRAANEGEPDTYRATDWEPIEISMVSVPAERAAKVRKDEGDHEVAVELREIEDTQTRSDAAGEEAPTQTNQEARTMPEANEPLVDLDQERKAAVAAERKRVADIKSAVRAARLSDEFADTLIAGDTSVDAARAAIIDELAKQDPNKGASGSARVEVGADEVDKRREVMTAALQLRADPSVKGISDAVKAGAREYRGMRLLDMAKESLEQSGTKTRGMSPREIAQAALGLDGSRAHTTSDFPFLLGATFARTLRASYAERPRTFLPFTRRASMPDFREMSRVQLSNLVGGLSEVSEAAEYTSGTFKEAKETYKLVKYGKTVPITWEAIINDDLSAFSRIPAAFAAAAAQKQSDIVYAILTGNPAMADGFNLFSTEHANHLASGTVINVDNLGIARAKIREQKGLENNVLNLEPRFLIVGSNYEQLALQFTSQNYVAAKSPDINVWAGTLQPIVEPRVTGNKWFLAADPGQVDTIEYSFLDGEEELFTEQVWNYKTDSYDLKARMVFAAKAIDHRGLFYNPGA
jgi:hypothetical protein